MATMAPNQKEIAKKIRKSLEQQKDIVVNGVVMVAPEFVRLQISDLTNERPINFSQLEEIMKNFLVDGFIVYKSAPDGTGFEIAKGNKYEAVYPNYELKGAEYFNGILLLNGKEIEILSSHSSQNYSDELLKTLIKNPHHEWSRDEILEDWYGKSEDAPEVNEAIKSNRLYHASNAIKGKIASQSGIKDFLIFTTMKFSINPKYL